MSAQEQLVEMFPEILLSPLGIKVVNLLDKLTGGLYRINKDRLRKVEWDNSLSMRITWDDHNLSTFDGDELTRFVFLCHDYCVRGHIQSAGRYLALLFDQRNLEGLCHQRHPTLEDAIREHKLAIR